MNCANSPQVCEIGGQRTQDEVAVVVRDGRFWVFFLTTLLAAIIIIVMMCHNQITPLPGQPPVQVFIVVWIVLYFIIAYISFRAVTIASRGLQMAIYILFFLNLILQVVWAGFFTRNNMQAALVTMGILIIAAIILFVLIWWVNPFYGFIFLFYIIWLFVALWFNMQSLHAEDGTDSESTVDSLLEVSVEEDSPDIYSASNSEIIS